MTTTEQKKPIRAVLDAEVSRTEEPSAVSCVRDPGASPGAVGNADLAMTYRQRMQLVGELLNASLDELIRADIASDRLGRAAYLHIIGQVFEAMDGLSQAIPLEDLTKLSKIVAEQRRAEFNARKAEPDDSNNNRTRNKSTRTRRTKGDNEPTSSGSDSEGKPASRLPTRLNGLVRHIYGATVARKVESIPDNQEDPKAEKQTAKSAGA